MVYVKDLKYKKDMKVKDLVQSFNTLGYQSIELAKAKDVIVKMKKESAKIFLTFTSNMVTSGLRGFFAQLIKLKMDIIIAISVNTCTGSKNLFDHYSSIMVECTAL